MSTKQIPLEQLIQTSHLSGGSMVYLESLYEAYLQDPNSVSAEWQQYFSTLPAVGAGGSPEVLHSDIQRHFLQYAKQKNTLSPSLTGCTPEHDQRQSAVTYLINAYRSYGHQQAKLDPLNLTQHSDVAELELSYYGLNKNDLDAKFNAADFNGLGETSLKTIVEALSQTYCGSLGLEFTHITDTEQTQWIKQQIESVRSQPQFSPEQKQKILKDLTAADGLEKYLGSKYVGQKRFSLEGGDSLIPLMNDLIQRAGSAGTKEVVVGMAHRGRLNVLVNVFGKSPKDLFEEFEGKPHGSISGDVKYHMGFSSDVQTPGGIVHLALAFNPSHLEIVNPVVEGSVRARQLRRNDEQQRSAVIPLLIHGDAAFAGQGVVMETLNFSQVRGYTTGGTVHIVINNQVGFTTSNPVDSRSTLYCTDIAKMVQAPIFHVNGDDPEAVVFAAQMALDFRMKFHKDVVIDLVCYRRHGHNEADDPTMTQPVMYQVVKKLAALRHKYAKQLIKENIISEQQAQDMAESYRSLLDAGQPVVELVPENPSALELVNWKPFLDKGWRESVKFNLPKKTLRALAQRLEVLPEGFKVQTQVQKMLLDRQKMTSEEILVNWGYAENLAYATLVDAGYPVRISGQDSGRGTFGHRHAVIHENATGETYIPLQHISDKQAPFLVIDSTLSEEAVLGFEYGFASAEPNALVIWEAQFGDFVNGAQVVIDQFISSAEQKWGRLCGLALFLPHGYEGQGPEHSSARLERFLQLCAQENMQVCVPSTPAQIYHMIRRQILRPFRKPLVVMTPKSLLRHKSVVSSLDELANGQFQVIIPEVEKQTIKNVERVVLCSGKVYYDLVAYRQEHSIENIAIIRLEQLYPFPDVEVTKELAQYTNAKQVVWCQEEPQNQGAWYPSQHRLLRSLAPHQTLSYAGREAAAAPAAGSPKLHLKQQQDLIAQALT